MRDKENEIRKVGSKLAKQGVENLLPSEKIILEFDTNIQAAMKATSRVAMDLSEYIQKSKSIMKNLERRSVEENQRRRLWEKLQKKKIDDLYIREKNRQIGKVKRYSAQNTHYKPLLDLILEDCAQMGYSDLKTKDLRVLLALKTGKFDAKHKIDRLIEGMITNGDLVRPKKIIYERGIDRKGMIRRLFAPSK